jgi:outer membrane protein TolC
MMPFLGTDTGLSVARRDRTTSGRLMRLLAGSSLSALLLAGCSLKPDVITPAEHVERAQADYSKIYGGYVPIDHPLGLTDAIARALKYNYDAQLAREQFTLQERQVDLAMAAMLPRLALNAGYNARTNDPAAQSIDERTKQVSLDYAFSEQPQHVTAGPEFTWSVLDLGLSYFQAKQQGYQSLVAVERRRKVIDTIVRKVQDSYWKALVSSEILPRLKPLLARAERILESSREATRRQLAPDMPMLEFQREMTQVVGQLHHIDTELNDSRAQLATLINVPTNTKLALAEAKFDLKQSAEPIDTHRLEEIGLALRPELREEAYQERIDRQDVYKEILKMMPGFGILANFNYDSNKYLFNNTWGGVGVQAGFNLANIIRGPRAISAAKQAVEVAKTRRLALSVAVLSQINLAYQSYVSALEDMHTSRDVLDVERKIGGVSRNARVASSLSDAQLIQRELEEIVAELNYYHNVSLARYALVTLYISCGVDLVPPTVELDDLGKMSQQLIGGISPWATGQLPEVDLPAPTVTPAPS